MRIMRLGLVIVAFGAGVVDQSKLQVLSHSAADLAAKDREIAAQVEGSKPSFALLGRTANTAHALLYRAPLERRNFTRVCRTFL